MNNNIGTEVTNTKNEVKTPLDNLINEIKNQIQQFVDGSGQYGKNSNNNIGTEITNTQETVLTPTRTLIANVKTLLNNFVTDSVNTGKGIDDSIGQGITDNHDTLMKTIDTISKNIIDQFNQDLEIRSPSKKTYAIGQFLMQGLINGMNEADIEKFITDKVGGMTGAINSQVVAVPGNIADWISQAMKATGVDASWLPALEMIASRESGNPGTLGTGNATLRNSVGVGGEYATGLMQTLPSTFQSYAMTGHDNILNPIDNAIASINYIKSRYKTPYAIPNWNNSNYIGYQNGTDNATPGMHELSEDGRPEIVIGKQSRLFNGGETVLNGDKTMNILQSLMPKFNMPDFSGLLTNKNNTPSVVHKHYEIGNLNLPNVNNTEQMINEITRLANVKFG